MVRGAPRPSAQTCMQGGSLGQLLRAQMTQPFSKLYSDQDALRWGAQLAGALHHLHTPHRPLVAAAALPSARGGPCGTPPCHITSSNKCAAVAYLEADATSAGLSSPCGPGFAHSCGLQRRQTLAPLHHPTPPATATTAATALAAHAHAPRAPCFDPTTSPPPSGAGAEPPESAARASGPRSSCTHAAGSGRWKIVIHRDIKLDNVLLRSSAAVAARGGKGQMDVVLADFGMHSVRADVPTS